MTLNAREATLVLPFYMNLMSSNATWVGHEVWDELVDVGRSVEIDDVVWLLRVGAWRPVVMGAWLSLRFEPEHVGAEVLKALRDSGGSLTTPPLATAAVILAGPDAIPALRDSRARIHEASSPTLDAAIEHLGAGALGDLGQEQKAAFAEMLAFGTRLRHALTSP